MVHVAAKGGALVTTQDEETYSPITCSGITCSGCKSPWTDVLSALVLGAKMRENPYSNPLAIAVEANDVLLAKALMKLGLDANESTECSRGQPVLHIAVKQNNAEMVRALLDGGANPNLVWKSFGLRPLHLAAEEGLRDIYALLVTFGADESLRDRSGRTASELLWNKSRPGESSERSR